MLRFFDHHTAAKGLMLTAMCSTAGLVLLSPSSLTGRAADEAGDLADIMAIGALLLALIGWVDVIWHDLMGRLIWPSLNERTRHTLCVIVYSLMTGFYAIFAFAAADPRVQTSWILLVYYSLTATFGAVLTISIAREDRRVEGAQ